MTARDNDRLVPQSGAETFGWRSEGVSRNGANGRPHPLGSARAFREGAWASGEFLVEPGREFLTVTPAILAKPRRHAAFDLALIPASGGVSWPEPGAEVWPVAAGGP